MVAGGSIAGLLAARVLSDHFEVVTLVEGDRLQRRPEPRKAVPQGRHVHILLARGRVVLEHLFPGLTDGLRAAGAQPVNARDIAWHHAGDWRARYTSDHWLLALSRPLLETHVSDRVRALPNVRVVEGSRIDGLVTEGGAVNGVRLKGDRHADPIVADLVVDATGRGTIMPGWLEQLGWAPPTTDTIPAPLTYSTCMFRRQEPAPDWRANLITGPGEKRAAFAWAIEGRRWLITLASLFDEPAPKDHQAFLAHAQSMPVPQLYDTIRDREPLTEVARYRFPGSQRRRFERARSFPAGWIAIGDAVSSFNPVYGQGMTVAALEAEVLARTLVEARRNGGVDERFVRRWFKEIGKIVDVAWQGISIEDFRFPELADARPASLLPVQWYMDRVHRATHASEAVTDQFYRVAGFQDPPTALFRPRVIADVLFAAGGKRRRVAQA